MFEAVHSSMFNNSIDQRLTQSYVQQINGSARLNNKLKSLKRKPANFSKQSGH